MGDPRRFRKKYSSPSHPWQKVRIDEETALKKEFGIPSNTEIWKMVSKLKDFKDRVKKLMPQVGKQAEIEKAQLIAKLQSLSLLQTGEGLDKVLSLTLKNVMDRRLQSLLVKKGLARTMKQARQMITHEHVLVKDKKITAPSYLVNIAEEGSISFHTISPFENNMHPERIVVKKEKTEEKVEKKEEETIAYKAEEIADPETQVKAA